MRPAASSSTWATRSRARRPTAPTSWFATATRVQAATPTTSSIRRTSQARCRSRARSRSAPPPPTRPDYSTIRCGTPQNGAASSTRTATTCRTCSPSGTRTTTATPDNYFLVTNALTLQDQLESAFDLVLSRTASASAVATNTTRLDTSTLIYQAQFRSDDWTGKLLAYRLQPNGTLGALQWDAASLIPAPNARAIYTRTGAVPGAAGGRRVSLERPRHGASSRAESTPGRHRRHARRRARPLAARRPGPRAGWRRRLPQPLRRARRHHQLRSAIRRRPEFRLRVAAGGHARQEHLHGIPPQQDQRDNGRSARADDVCRRERRHAARIRCHDGRRALRLRAEHVDPRAQRAQRSRLSPPVFR